MIKLLCAKFFHALTYGVWLIVPFAILVIGLKCIKILVLGVTEAVSLTHRNLKDKVLLWYLENYW